MNGFREALEFVLQWEGGYVNHPADPGGATNKGVTQKRYDQFRDEQGQPRQSVKLIGDPEVARIYEDGYWLASGAGGVPWPMSLCVFDAAVNCGPGMAKRWLGTAGVNPQVFNDLRRSYYHALVAKKPSLGVFLKGWLNRVNALDNFRKAA